MSEKRVQKVSVKSEKRDASMVACSKQEGKRTFIEPELKEYPSLKEVTLLTVSGATGATFFKTFK